MKTGCEWLAILREDPMFESLVEESRIFKKYRYDSALKINVRSPVERSKKQARLLFRSGLIKAKTDLYIEQRYGEYSGSSAFKNALTLWFAENWERWVAENAGS